MKHKYALYPIIMSGCALFCFLLVVIIFASDVVQPLWWQTMLLLVPCLILGIIGFFAVKGKLKVSVTVILTTALSIVLFLVSVFYLSLLLVWTSTTVTTDIRYYGRAYEKICEEPTVEEVFPKSVPEDADDVIFTYFPAFLQGGEVFELSYTTTDEKLTEWSTLLESEAKWIGSNQEWHAENNQVFNDVDTMRYQLDWDGGYNHGEICYVLIDEEKGRITFYYSDW